MLRKKVFLYVSFVKSVQFVCAIIPLLKEHFFINFLHKLTTFFLGQEFIIDSNNSFPVSIFFILLWVMGCR